MPKNQNLNSSPPYSKVAPKHMSLRYKYIPVYSLIVTLCVLGCTGTKQQAETTYPKFTKIDSLTEKYLNLEDSLLIAWNTIVHDERTKFRRMHDLVHHLSSYDQTDQEALQVLQQRLDQLGSGEFQQEFIKNTDYLEEYDFAVNSLIQELTTMAQAHPQFTTDEKLRKLLNDILEADQRVDTNRQNYDLIAREYNTFLEMNGQTVKEIDSNISLERKALFQIVKID